MAATVDKSPIEFRLPPQPPADPLGATTSLIDTPTTAETAAVAGDTLTETTVPTPPGGTRARTLAEALAGISMPCDLAPLMGTGPLNPSEVAFFTAGYAPGDVGVAIANELERLSYEITPVDDRTIRATRDQDLVRARIVSGLTDSEDVFAELHPSAPKDAVVVELKLH